MKLYCDKCKIFHNVSIFNIIFNYKNVECPLCKDKGIKITFKMPYEAEILLNK